MSAREIATQADLEDVRAGPIDTEGASTPAFADQPPAPPERWDLTLGLALSAAFHVAAFAMLALLSDPPQPYGVSYDDVVEVVLVPLQTRAEPRLGEVADAPRGTTTQPADDVSSAAPAPLQQHRTQDEQVPADLPTDRASTDAPPSPTAKDAARITPAPPRRRVPELTEARTLYTSRLRDTALGRAALAELDLADPEERIFQLCTYEAVEQLRREHPDLRFEYAIAEAREEATLTGLALEAKGAAIQGRGRWYDLSFRCEVAEDLMGVTGFAFALGPEITRPERDDLDLPVDGPIH